MNVHWTATAVEHLVAIYAHIAQDAPLYAQRMVDLDLMKRVDPLAATALLLTFGSVGMLAFGLPAAEGFDPSSVPRFTWFLGVLIIVFPTALAYLINTWALARAESSRVAFFIYLQPLIATSLSYAIFDEKLDAAVFGGAAMIFGSVYIALRRPGKSV